MMRTPSACLFMCLLVACGQRPPSAVNDMHRMVVTPARGRTTWINATNAPDTVPVTHTNVPAPVFTPVRTGGHAMPHLRTFTTDDGLAMDDILCGHRDADGVLWFGTNGGGISRYDGTGFINFTTAHGLPDNVILSLNSDRLGNLWIGTSTGGLCKFDGHRFTTIALNEGTGLTKGITGIVEDKQGVLWFGTRGWGIYRHENTGAGAKGVGNFTAAELPEGPKGQDVVGMTLGADGAVWAVTRTRLLRQVGDHFVAVAVPSEDPSIELRGICATPDGAIWTGSSAGVWRCTMTGSQPHLQYHPVVQDASVGIWALWPTGGSAVWLATDTHGAVRLELLADGGARVERIDTESGLGTDEVLSMVEDRSGDLWFGTRGAGLCQYRGSAFSNYRGIKAISLAEGAEDALFVGTTNSLVRIKVDTTAEWRRPDDLGGWVYAIGSDGQGRIGLAEDLMDLSRSGFSMFDGNGCTLYRTADDRHEIFWSLLDRHGDIWLAGRHGIEHWMNDTDGRIAKRATLSTTQGIGNINGLCLLEANDGHIWAGTDGGGLSRITRDSVTTWTTNEGLPNNVVWCMAEEADGILWIATLGGLCRYDGSSFLTLTTRDGLPDDNINQLLITRDGRLIVGTLNGIAVLTGWTGQDGTIAPFNGPLRGAQNEAIARCSPVFDVYNTRTGFPVKDVQTAQHSILEDRTGVVWIATGSDKTRLVRFDPAALRMDTSALKVQIRGIQVNNETVCWHQLVNPGYDSVTLAQQEIRVLGRTFTPAERQARRKVFRGVRLTGITPHRLIPEGLVLDHAHNRIGFSYVGIETTRPGMVEYQVRLDGYDADWSLPSNATNVTYGNVDEGEYVFRVRAKSPTGVWSAPQEFRFTVLPPWHRTWWAYLLYVSVLGGGVIGYVRLRLASLKRQRSRLEHTVALRTEELKRKKDEADEQRTRAELSEKAKERFLANMSHEIRTPMNAIMGMSDILKDRTHLPEQAKFLAAIHQSSENLLVIINDILDLTKIDSGRIEFEQVPFDPHGVIENVRDVLQFKADEKHIALTVEVTSDVPKTLIGDPTRLNQIVMNLVGNAIKFTERGSVTIRCSTGPTDRRETTLLIIDVIDTGIGIPEDRIDLIFEEFTQAYSDTTRKHGGTGLGLTISRRLAEQQGGNVSVKSERNKGSTFTVRIPYQVHPDVQ